ncbi:PEP-CTERM sorting domain-containing protein [Flocculibacter collagenilyticus]|uniref:PEP-CTERM sorting domain-containing protein n=1 Tax=Flocculibacter collagenilyticus TaxID=2744479 RepID=UPI0018F31B5A|nr:PEP-CTERM sorting domain-containing protein [Flocculibacter collagenilyticus]
MSTLRRLSSVVLATLTLFTASVNATILIWDFTVEIDDIYDDANVIDDSVVVGSLLKGSFSYDDGLTDTSPMRSYSDTYEAANGLFTIEGLTLNPLEIELSVVHQGTRDIVDIYGEFSQGLIWEYIGFGFLDYSQSYDNGALPTNWANAPVALSDIDFEYTYFDDNLFAGSSLEGVLVSVEQRAAAVPEPSVLVIFMLGLIAFFGVSRVKG